VSSESPKENQQLISLVKDDQTVELYLDAAEVPEPGPDQVLVRVEAAPINPSDLGLLFAGADMSAATFSGTPERPVVTAPLSPAAARAMAGRVGHPMPVGNEGAGTVVGGGDSAAARALIGKSVAVAGGAMYSQFRCVDTWMCLELPPGTPPADGASSFVNPMTALGMVETMRLEQHRALVHTAAASNLGQMLNRLCIEEQIPLVNIVRRPEQESLLRSAGATYVCDSSSPTYMSDLIEALKSTSATLAFDAIGGGRTAGQILTCMEAAAAASATEYSRYGSSVHKQVYIYGGLDRSPTELVRSWGMAWGVSGWLLTPFLGRIGLEAIERMRRRVQAGLKSTFASRYTAEVSLAGALSADAIGNYGRQATGTKYLINPNA
jgi:NADPH2:quinone reductase